MRIINIDANSVTRGFDSPTLVLHFVPHIVPADEKNGKSGKEQKRIKDKSDAASDARRLLLLELCRLTCRLKRQARAKRENHLDIACRRIWISEYRRNPSHNNGEPFPSIL